LVRVQPPQPILPSEREGLHRVLAWCTPRVPRKTQILFRAWVTSSDFLKCEKPLWTFRETLPSGDQPTYPRRYNLFESMS
jgi:hypothetical protein